MNKIINFVFPIGSSVYPEETGLKEREVNNKPTNVNPWRMPAVAATLLLALVIFGLIINGEPRPSINNTLPVIAKPHKKSHLTQPPADTQNKKAAKRDDTINIQSPAKHTAKTRRAAKAPVGVTLPTVSPTTTTTEPVTKTAVPDAGAPLDESLVMDYAAKKKAAHPKNGWDNFQKYINDKAVSADGKTGTVELSFTVNSKGTVNDDVKVIKSLSDAADKAAIELIKNGPTWADADTSTDPVTVKVQFH